VKKTQLILGKLNVEISMFSETQSRSMVLRQLFGGELTGTMVAGEGEQESAWVIADNEIRTVEGKEFAVGKLGRIGSRHIARFKKNPRGFDQIELKDMVVAVSRFALEIDRERLVFEQVRYISPQQFAEAFAEIMVRSDERLRDASVFPDVVPQDYSAEFSRIRSIHRIKFELVSPNSLGDFYDAACAMRKVFITDTGADRVRVDCQTKAREGLIRQSQVVQIAQFMPVHTPQYGLVVVSGTTETGEPIVLRSIDKAKRVYVEVPADQPEVTWNRFIEVLLKEGRG